MEMVSQINFRKLKFKKMKWKSKMQTLGLDESSLSVRIKKNIKDYYSLIEGLNEAKAEINNDNLSQEEVDSAQDTIDELTNAVSIADNNLANDIEKYHKNKDLYDKRTSYLNNSAKKTSNAPAQTQTAKSGIAVAGVTATNTKPQSTAPQGEVKKSGLGKWLLGGVLVVLTGGAILNYMKNND